MRREKPGPFPLDRLSQSISGGELHKFLAHVDHVDQPGAHGGRLVLRVVFLASYRELEIAGFLPP